MIAAHAAGIRVFATGGIGGVHRGALAGAGGGAPSFDISSDLEELGRTPMAVVCAGPKAILDVPATLEYLETRGVPVISVGQAELPGFYARSSGIAAPHVVADVAAAAAVVGGAPRARAGERRAGVRAGTRGSRHSPRTSPATRSSARSPTPTRPASTARPSRPWLLARIAELTAGASVRANTALIVNDARVAGELAAALAR